MTGPTGEPSAEPSAEATSEPSNEASNEAMRSTWTTGGQAWVRNERILDAAFTPFTDALLGAADLASARRVLDVGCGGGTVLAAAAEHAPAVVGIDISPTMTDAARARVPVATVVTADAQTADLLEAAPGPAFDRVVSRFGVMFFDDPARAFANIRAAAAPGARLAFVSWRADGIEDFTLGLGRLLARIDDPPSLPAPGTPGPMGLSDEHHIRSVLADSGWGDVEVVPVDGTCDYSLDGSDGVEERLAVALSGMVGRPLQARLEPELGPEGWELALDDARAELREHLVGGAVRILNHVWLVTATNPAT